ncbi:hypothetical protein ECIV_ORF72 [European chub iridovirus]|nr:hypothetical protein ECIV_ORF72 [European chub iridovirus]
MMAATTNINSTVTAYVRLLERIKDTREKLKHMNIEKEYFSKSIADYMSNNAEQQLKFNDDISVIVKSKSVTKAVKPNKEDILIARGIDRMLVTKIMEDFNKSVESTDVIHKNYICLKKQRNKK